MPESANTLRTRLDGQVALVTGASSGLGRRFAQILAAAGAAVAVTARRRERLDALVTDIQTAGGRAAAFTLDVADPTQCLAIVGAIEETLGPVDILVNNAAVPDGRRAERMPLELIDRVIAVNLRAPWLLSTEVARRLIAAERPGRIVNISSMYAFEYDGSGAALYATTKAALIRMTEALAVEWAARRINVNAIAPGAFSTEMLDGMIERGGDLTAGFPRRRLGDPAQLDSTLLYLVAPASDFVTGAVIKVDDGQHYR